jgi:hypothetical protein
MITIFNLIGGFGGGARSNIYAQDRPTLTTPQTRAASGLTLAGSIFPADLTSRHVILSGAFTGGAALNGIVGDLGDPYLFTNENSSTLIGTTSNPTASIGGLNGTNNIELWGLDKDNPLEIRAGSGQSGIQFNPIVGGGIYRIYNVSGKDIGYATLLFSAPSSGGSYYKRVAICWLSRNGLVTEGEHIYIGHVSTETTFERNVLLHNSGISMGREAVQIKWSESSRIYNNTYKTIGQVSDTAQQHALQVEVSADTRFYDNIFDGAKRSVNIFSHDIIIKGGVIRWTSTAGYFGKASTFWPGNPLLNGLPVIFDGVTFIFDNAGSGYFAQWEETDCDLTFSNCRFSDNINSAIVQDIRGGSPTNTLTGTTTTNGNTSVAKATLLAQMPTYIEEADETSKNFMCVPTSNYYFTIGAGKGTPTLRTVEILDVKEAVTETVAYATAFAGLSNPSTIDVLLSSGYWVSVSVSWAAGSYDGNTAGTYTIYGTLSGYTNTDGILAEKKVIVEAYVPPDTVRVNLAGTSGAYVSSGNWNNIFQNFGSGNQTIKGDNSGETLASLRKVGGSLTGYQLNIVTGFDSGALGQAAGGAGVYPDNAILGNWSNPGSAGTSRSFKLTGLDNAKTYTIRILGSAADYLSGTSHLVTVQVSGASGGGTLSNQEIEANISNVMTFPGCVPTGGEITIRVEKTATGQAYVNVLDFEWS